MSWRSETYLVTLLLMRHSPFSPRAFVFVFYIIVFVLSLYMEIGERSTCEARTEAFSSSLLSSCKAIPSSLYSSCSFSMGNCLLTSILSTLCFSWWYTTMQNGLRQHMVKKIVSPFKLSSCLTHVYMHRIFRFCELLVHVIFILWIHHNNWKTRNRFTKIVLE